MTERELLSEMYPKAIDEIMFADDPQQEGGIMKQEELSVSQAQGLIAATAQTWRRWLRDGEFPNAYKRGGGRSCRWMIPLGDIDAFKRRYGVRMATN